MRAVVIALLLWSAMVSAEPLRIRSSSSVVTDGGSNLRLPPGYFLDDEQWVVLDTEVRRLQDAETRLKAENQELRKKPPGQSLVTTGVVLLLGVLIGAAAF